MNKILIVEDDQFIRDLYEFAFSQENYTVDTAIDGEIAIQKLTTSSYDIILLDIMLPKVSGMDVLKKIKSTENPSKNTPIVLSTNLSEEKIIKDALELGVNGYVLKSETEPTDIVKQVTAILEKTKSATS